MRIPRCPWTCRWQYIGIAVAGLSKKQKLAWAWQALRSVVHLREIANGGFGAPAESNPPLPSPPRPLVACLGCGGGHEGSGFSSSAKSSPVSRDALMSVSLMRCNGAVRLWWAPKTETQKG